MPRLNLPEIEDVAGLPDWIRDAITGYLRVALELGRPYAAVTPTLAALIREGDHTSIVDLASGGGGPWPHLSNALGEAVGRPVAVTLTDLRPNAAAAADLEQLPGLHYERQPVSALDIPQRLRGVRTIFTGLHHFPPDDVRRILRAAQADQVPFLAAEATHRSLRGVLVTLLIPLMVLALMPRVRPRRALALVLTYLPPLLPLLIWWDGFASTLRTYRRDELARICDEIGAPGYEWRVEEITVAGAPIPVTVLSGRPRA